MKWLLLIIGILNVLEGIKVLVQKIPAPFLKYELNAFTHGLFHLLVGGFLVYLYRHEAILATPFLKYTIGAIGLVAIAYSVVVFSKKQNAEKFGYSISYPIHASYYFGIGLVLLLLIGG